MEIKEHIMRPDVSFMASNSHEGVQFFFSSCHRGLSVLCRASWPLKGSKWKIYFAGVDCGTDGKLLQPVARVMASSFIWSLPDFTASWLQQVQQLPW